MADLSDVSEALRDLITGELYPDGLAGPAMPDLPVKVYAGWPDPKTLDDDLHAKPDFPKLHISIFPLPMERNTTRYPDEWMERPRDAATYVATVAGQNITISGAAPAPYRAQNVAVIVDKTAFPLRIAEGRTAAQVASDLAALIAVTWPGTTAINGVISVPQPGRVVAANVGIMGSAVREVGRQEKGFQVTLWANTDANRRWLAKRIVPVLADTAFLTLPDGFGARLICRQNVDTDRAQGQSAFRRDLVYTVEYATTREMAAPEMIVAKTEIRSPAGDAIATLTEG